MLVRLKLLDSIFIYIHAYMQAVRNITWSIENLRQFVDKNNGKQLEGMCVLCVCVCVCVHITY